MYQMRGENDWYTQLLGLLPTGWEAKAKETGALRRRRGIQTAADLLRLILLYMTEGVSFAGTVALARLSEIAEISKVALYKRLRNSGAWLQWLCQHVYRQAGLTVEKPEWLKGREVIIVDGSETVKCGVRRQCYMLHYSMELFTLDMRYTGFSIATVGVPQLPMPALLSLVIVITAFPLPPSARI